MRLEQLTEDLWVLNRKTELIYEIDLDKTLRKPDNLPNNFIYVLQRQITNLGGVLTDTANTLIVDLEVLRPYFLQRGTRFRATKINNDVFIVRKNVYDKETRSSVLYIGFELNKHIPEIQIEATDEKLEEMFGSIEILSYEN